MRLRSTQLEVRYEILPKHYGESRIVKWKEKEYALGAGSSDTVEFWRDLDAPSELYVLTYNYGLGYMGLDLLDANVDYPHDDAPEYDKPVNELFLQDPDDAWSGIDREGRTRLSDMYAPNAIRVMSEYLGDR